MTLVGGRAVHPVNVRVGGFYRLPTRERARGAPPAAAAGPRRRGRDRRLGRRLRLPRLRADPGVRRAAVPARLPARGRHLRDRAAGRAFDVAEFGAVIASRSTSRDPRAARAPRRAHDLRRRAARPLLAQPGPALRRSPARRPRAAGLGPVVPQPVPVDRRSCRRAGLRLRRGAADHRRLGGRGCARPSRSRPTSGVGHGATEAPRGLLYHRYQLAADGTIEDAVIVPPTSQNLASIEEDLPGFVQDRLHLPHDELIAAVRAGRPQLRPVHLVRHALPRPDGGAHMTALLIGLGNLHRGDDGVGIEVARRAVTRGPPVTSRSWRPTTRPRSSTPGPEPIAWSWSTPCCRATRPARVRTLDVTRHAAAAGRLVGGGYPRPRAVRRGGALARARATATTTDGGRDRDLDGEHRGRALARRRRRRRARPRGSPRRSHGTMTPDAPRHTRRRCTCAGAAG